MNDLWFIGAAPVVLVAVWFLWRTLKKKQQRASNKRVSVKLNDGAPPDDIYPMW